MVTKLNLILHQVDSEHGLKWEGRAASSGANLGGKRLNQIDQRLPGHYLVHIGQKPLTFGPLFDGALKVINKAQLPASDQSSTGQRLLPYSRVDRGGFPKSS